MIHILCNSLALYELFRTFAERNLIPIIIMSTFISGEILKSVYQRISQGGQYRTKDLLPLVQKDCGLTDQQMQEKIKGGSCSKVMKRVQWSLFLLYGAGLIYKVSRGLYEIAPQKEHLLGLSEKDFEDLVNKIYNSRDKESSPTKGKQNRALASSLNNDWTIPSMSYPLGSFAQCLLAEPNTKTKDGRKALKEKQQSLAQQLEDIVTMTSPLTQRK